MATLTLKDLQRKKTTSAETPRGTFKAQCLIVTVTDPNGNEVFRTELQPRAFSPKVSGSNGKSMGGVGWYGSAPAGSTFRGLPISAGFRVSLTGLKIGPKDKIDLMPEEEGDE